MHLLVCMYTVRASVYVREQVHLYADLGVRASACINVSRYLQATFIFITECFHDITDC